MASKIYPNVKFKLFGDQNISEPELKKSGVINAEFFHTEENIKSDDEPVTALRKLKKSSMRLGINNVSNSESQFCISWKHWSSHGNIKVCIKDFEWNKPTCNSRFDANYERSNGDIGPGCKC